MKLIEALDYLGSELEKGKPIETVTVEPGEDSKLLVCGWTPDGSVELALCIDDKELLIQLIELQFRQRLDSIKALERLMAMPLASDQ
jgi:hypothetical protein